MMSNPDDKNPASKHPEHDPDAIAALAAATRPADLPAATREALRARVLERARDTAPEGTRTLRADAGGWLALDAHVQVRVLRRDAGTRTQTVLMRVAAGGRYPAHRHTQDEEFIVLEGECRIGAHRLGAGDVHLAAAGSWHDDITTSTGVLVMVRGEMPADSRLPPA
jgi:quercetin dioxygenase-like cupin family protein